MDGLKKLHKSIIAGNVAKASTICRELMEDHISSETIINEVLVPSMSELSSGYDSEKIYIPQLLLSSKALNECIRTIQNYTEESEIPIVNRQVKVVIGTIQGDIHSIGKSIVAYLLKTCGCEIIDLGTNVSGKQFIDAVYQHNADCVVISAMLTSTLIHLKNATDALAEEKFEKEPYVLIGGALITEAFAKEIGVEYGFSAIDTVNKVKEYFHIEQ